jgi:glutaredoxin
MSENKSFFASLSPRSALLVGLSAGVLVLGTLGFIIMLVMYLSGGSNKAASVNTPAANQPAAVAGNITPAQPLPKTATPKFELYVFTYCPYGLQAEKALFPVVELLGNKADFQIRQIGAMHGPHEELEAKRQLCIEKNYSGKFMSYLKEFALDTSCPEGQDTCITSKLAGIYSKLGMSASKIDACVASDGVALYQAEEQNSAAKQAYSSPTIAINDVVIGGTACSAASDCRSFEQCVQIDQAGNKECSLSRTAEAYKAAICSAFTNPPAACSQTLTTASPSYGFGAGTNAGDAAAAACN